MSRKVGAKPHFSSKFNLRVLQIQKLFLPLLRKPHRSGLEIESLRYSIPWIALLSAATPKGEIRGLILFYGQET